MNSKKYGSEHHMWKGDKASYSAFHYRVVAQRGKPQKCEECSDTKGDMCWANVTGKYEDPNDYIRLCRSCHQRKDIKRRIETQQMTCPKRPKDNRFKHANRCILTEAQIIEAKRLKDEGWTWVALGKRYRVVSNTVKFAVNGKTWSHLQKDGVSSTSKLS